GRVLRLARAGLLDVPGDESGQACARRALRLDLEPQLRRPSGLQGPHAPGVARDGGRRRDRRTLRRYPRLALSGDLKRKGPPCGGPFLFERLAAIAPATTTSATAA